MAHILVYLQRTPSGLHPASAVALCRARDIASERGATLTALCKGDAGPLDKGIAAAAGRYGADILVFGGPGGLGALCEQLNPVHVLVPWTAEGMAAAEVLPGGPAVPRWMTTRRPAWGGADAVTAVAAGVLPWHAFAETLEAEYQADVDAVKPPTWADLRRDGERAPVFSIGGRGPRRWVASRTAGDDVAATLSRLSATEADDVDDAVQAGTGTLVWLSADALPEALADRPATMRLVIVPGVDDDLHPSWCGADWVLPGPANTALESLLDGPWGPEESGTAASSDGSAPLDTKDA